MSTSCPNCNSHLLIDPQLLDEVLRQQRNKHQDAKSIIVEATQWRTLAEHSEELQRMLTVAKTFTTLLDVLGAKNIPGAGQAMSDVAALQTFAAGFEAGREVAMREMTGIHKEGAAS